MPGKGLLAVVATAVFLSSVFASPTAASASNLNIQSMIDQVTGDSILSTVVGLQGFGSRAFELNSSAQAANYIFDRFHALGLNVEYQDFNASGFETRNVIATMPGTSPDKPRFLFGAHYDSYNDFLAHPSPGMNSSAPGADDDASGVAGVIELASVLSSRTFEQTIMFVAFGAEELSFNETGGTAGSSAFVASEKAAGTDFAGTAVLDMIGYRVGAQDRCTLIVNSDADPLVNATQRAVSEYGLGIDLKTISNPYISFSDHWPFWQAGYPSMLVIEQIDSTTFYPVNPFYHTSQDLAYHLSSTQMASMTKALLAGILTIDVSSGSSGGIPVTLIVVVVVVAAAVATVMIIYATRRRTNHP